MKPCDMIIIVGNNFLSRFKLRVSVQKEFFKEHLTSTLGGHGKVNDDTLGG